MDQAEHTPPMTAAQGAALECPDSAIRDCILSLLQTRAPSASLCPSEIARRLAPAPETGWRGLMPRVRAVAAAMARQQLLQFCQRGLGLDPDALPRGPLRIRRGPRFPPD